MLTGQIRKFEIIEARRTQRALVEATLRLPDCGLPADIKDAAETQLAAVRKLLQRHLRQAPKRKLDEVRRDYPALTRKAG